jgi:hypothetical protein
MAPRLRLREGLNFTSVSASIAVTSGLLVLWPCSAAAAPADAPGASTQSSAVTECVEAHASGQELRQEGRLLESRAKFLECSQERCPDLVRSECLGILDELRTRIPSVVFRVAVDGEPRSDVAASIDGNEIGGEIPTRAFEVNPGKHRFVFRHGQLQPLQRDLTITEGEKLVPVSASFVSPQSAPQKPPSVVAAPELVSAARPVPVPVYVLAGVGVLGLGSFVGFGIATRSKEGSLRSTCSPSCAQAEIDALERRALAADVSLGLGLAAVAAATTYYLLRPSETVEIGAAVAPRAGIHSHLLFHF